jgi:cell division inhibitor SepF
MGALQKLKAYFGMVPADDFDEYDAADEYGYADSHSYRHRPAYLDDDDDYEPYPPATPRRRLFSGLRSGYRSEYDAEPHDREDDYEPVSRPRSRPSWTPHDAPVTPVHGALAVEPRREPMTRPRAEPIPQPSAYPLGRIVTLHPTSYNEARTIGEHYRDGTPVIMNLTEMDDADAKRLVDFAAGLAFALRGSIDKVTNKVFLISPPNVDPSAEDKRRIAEGGLLARS